MDRNFYDSAFEDLIREKADQYKMYPSDKVWKGVHSSLHTRKKWYWSGFVLLLSGISYFAITELVTPVPVNRITKAPVEAPAKPVVDPEEFVPFSSPIAGSPGVNNHNEISGHSVSNNNDLQQSLSDNGPQEDNGLISESFELPLNSLYSESDNGTTTTTSGRRRTPGTIVITSTAPLTGPAQYNIELSWPVTDKSWPVSQKNNEPNTTKVILRPEHLADADHNRINWLQEDVVYAMPKGKPKRLSWQLAFSPTINYRKLSGSRNAYMKSSVRNIPLALSIEGDVDNLVNHKPALGFELGSHALYSLARNLILKGGIQFNYSRYDIAAFTSPDEDVATISLNNPASGMNTGSLMSYSSIRNFGGSASKDLRNQYFQVSMPVGLELRLLGNDKLQLNIAGTFQPTYLLNRNTYLITTDYKNYTKEPSLVRRWNVNTSAEAFISYYKSGVKWQVGPQFRYQLFSSYSNEYPIKEYLMEYGIKIGITKTIR